MTESRSRLATAAALLVVGAAAFALRVVPLWPRVMAPERIDFNGTDAWYHLRLADALAITFPQPLDFDPYARAPRGSKVDTAPLLDLVVVGLSLVGSGGEPTTRTIETVAAFLPPILGTATCLLAWALARSLWGPLAGLLAAACLAVVPGPFLLRTGLGFADHHALEAFLATAVMTGLGLALRGPEPGKAWAALAGVATGLYLATWRFGFVVIAVVMAWSIALTTLDLLRRRRCSTAIATAVWAPAALATIAPFATLSPSLRTNLGAVALATLGSLALVGIIGSAGRRFPSATAAGLVAASITGVGLMVAFMPRLVELGADKLLPHWSVPALAAEARPLIAWDAQAPRALWTSYAALLPVTFAGFLLLAHRQLRRPRPMELLLLVWGAATLVATLLQMRFGYYFALPIALFSGFVGNELLRSTVGAPRLRQLAAAVAVLGLIVAPSALRSWRTAPAFYGPSAAWHEVLDWLREETPEPFGSPRAYFEGGRTERASYSILAWWDYGYWILREGRRVPVANPTQRGSVDAARMLLAQDEAELEDCFGRLLCRYAIVDADLLLVRPAGRGLSSGKFDAIVARAEEPAGRFAERAWLATGPGDPVPTVIFRPDYFRTLAVRLYLYGGQAVEPPGPVWAVRFGEPGRPRPDDLRTVVEAHRFASYELATQLQVGAEPGAYEIVGFDPFSTCVPLAALAHFTPVFESPARAGLVRGVPLPEIRVFELDPP